MNYHPDGTDISSLYMDRGYLFFGIQPEEIPQSDGTVDIHFQIYEGVQVRIDNITFSGNEGMTAEELLTKLDMRQGELFSRAQLIKAQQTLAGLGIFDPDDVMINPIPDPEKGTVAIEFVLSKPKN